MAMLTLFFDIGDQFGTDSQGWTLHCLIFASVSFFSYPETILKISPSRFSMPEGRAPWSNRGNRSETRQVHHENVKERKSG